MRIEELLELVSSSTLKKEQLKEAIYTLDYEIDSCQTIVADIETELHSRREFQAKLRNYINLKNKLKNEFKGSK